MQNTKTHDKHGSTVEEARREKQLDKEIAEGLQDISSGIDRLTHERDEAQVMAAEWKRRAEGMQVVLDSTLLGREEAAREIALWKKATGRDDPKALDLELGHAGIDAHLRVLSEQLAWTRHELDRHHAEEQARLRAGTNDERSALAQRDALVEAIHEARRQRPARKDCPACDPPKGWRCPTCAADRVLADALADLRGERPQHPPIGFGGCATCRHDGRGITGACRTCTRDTYSKWEAKDPPPLPPESAPQEKIDAAVEANRRPGESFDDALNRLVAAKMFGGKR